MRNIKQAANILRNNSKVLFVIALLAYVLVAFYYTPVSFTQCTDTVAGFGDSTAGPIWRNDVDKSNPLWGFEVVTNYPDGENLYNPALVSGLGQYSAYWLLAKIFGSVCAYNVLNILGYVLTAMAMFLFVFWITKKNSVSLLAGYLISFTPYLQVKVGGHPSYGYIGLIIIVSWLLLLIYKKPGIKYGVLLALFSAVSVYFDPYFILFLMAVYLSFVLSMAYKNRRSFGLYVKKLISAFILPVLLFILLISPMFYVYISQKAAIDSVTSGTRGSQANIIEAAKICSNYPHEYIVPVGDNYFIDKITHGAYKKDLAGASDLLKKQCNNSEDNVYISWAVIAVVIFFSSIIIWIKITRRSIKFKNFGDVDVGGVLLFAYTLVGLAAILALPAIEVFGIPTPSRFILDYITIWRIFSRLYLLVLIGFVIIFSIGLAYILSSIDKKYHKYILLIVFLIIFIEYQVSRPFTNYFTFSYSKTSPQIYHEIAKDNSFKVMVEYPLERIGETDVPVYYVTMQSIHKKRLLNGINPNSSMENIRLSIKDLSDPQSLPVLKALGVERLMVHGLTSEEARNIKGLEVINIYEDQFNASVISSLIPNNNIVYAKISDSVLPATYATVISSGYSINFDLQKSVTDVGYELSNSAIVKSIGLEHNDKLASFDYCFDIAIAGASTPSTIRLTGDGGEILNVTTYPNAYIYIPIKLTTASSSIKLSNDLGYNMRIKNLGCQ